MAKILIVSGTFYTTLAEELRNGAVAEIESAGYTYDEVEVPGALEIPQAIRYGIQSGKYVGYVALGTVIRGETAHYDIVAGESARALMNLSLQFQAPIGNGILTVENHAQAWVRAAMNQKNKGGDAVRAAIRLINLKDEISA